MKRFELNYFQVVTGNCTIPTATVRLIVDGNQVTDSACSAHSSLDAIFKTIDRITKIDPKITKNETATNFPIDKRPIKVKIIINLDQKIFSGQGESMDIIEANVLAYIDALNNFSNQ